jgi:hypothetical protein
MWERGPGPPSSPHLRLTPGAAGWVLTRRGTSPADRHPLAPGKRRNSFCIGEKRRYGGDDHYRVREQLCPGEQARAIAATGLGRGPGRGFDTGLMTDTVRVTTGVLSRETLLDPLGSVGGRRQENPLFQDGDPI